MPELTLIFKTDTKDERVEVGDLVDQMLGVFSWRQKITVTDENGLRIYPWPETKYKVGDRAWTWEHHGKGDWRPVECEVAGAYPELDYDDEGRLYWRFFYMISKGDHKREVEEFAVLSTLEEAEARCTANAEKGW